MFVSHELADLLSLPRGEMVPRPDIVRLVWSHITNNNLQDQEDRRYVLPDDRLATVVTHDRFRGITITRLLDDMGHTRYNHEREIVEELVGNEDDMEVDSGQEEEEVGIGRAMVEVAGGGRLEVEVRAVGNEDVLEDDNMQEDEDAGVGRVMVEVAGCGILEVRVESVDEQDSDMEQDDQRMVKDQNDDGGRKKTE